VNGSEIIIELLSRAGTPPIILVTWPPQASAIAPVVEMVFLYDLALVDVVVAAMTDRGVAFVDRMQE
jgi:hypothetical protein